MPDKKKIMIPKRNDPIGEDEKLWQRVTASIKPLVPDHQRPYTEPPSERPDDFQEAIKRSYKQRQRAISDKNTELMPTLDHGRAPGLDKRSSQRLNKGRLKIDARLDLHGSTQQEARRDLNAFVERSYIHGHRCVLVITGKGLRLQSGEIGVLRRAVPQWLNEIPLRPKILGFSHATPKDGGEGALYVLLKRKR